MRRAFSLRTVCVLSLASLVGARALGAQVIPFPETFQVRDIATPSATIHIRVGGTGPAVVLLHGFGDTGDMWAPLAAELAQRHTVIVPDLRGVGLSSHPASGYDKWNEASDIAAVLDSVGVDKVIVVAHDIGNMVGFALTRRYPARITRFVFMDAPIPGIANWDELSHGKGVWHFYFQGPDEERLVAGRERIFLDRFYNEFAANPARIDEATRAHYASLYALPGAMHSALSQFAAFDQDAADNRRSLARAGKSNIPVLAIGGERSYGRKIAAIASAAFTNVRAAVIPDAGHWLMEEQPQAVITTVTAFVDGPATSAAATHRTPRD